MRPFQLRYLNEQLVGLIEYKKVAEPLIAEQEFIIGDYKLIVTKKDEQITNLKIMNKNTKRVWLIRGLGIGFGGISLGTLLGLIIPYLINR